MEKIKAYARLERHQLVPITKADYDLDVSGAISPFDRPGLGRWLKDDRLHLWDGLIVASLDRLSRSLIHFVTLMSWLEARSKALICLDPQLDLATPSGRAFAQVLMTFAEYERETIAARVRDAWHTLRTDGQYTGGQVPFGYRPAKLVRGWGYEPDPEYAPVVAEMFNRYAGQESLSSIARWLNGSGVPTPWNATRKRNGKPLSDAMWRTPSVRKILGSPAALGATVKSDGTAVRDPEGVVLYRSDALVSRDIWERVHARLQANPARAKVNSWLLSGIAFCAVWGAAMYASSAQYDGKRYIYYCCMHSLQRDGKCIARRVKAGELESLITDRLLNLAGNRDLMKTKAMLGSNYGEEVARMADQISRLSREVALGAISGRDIRADQEALQRAHEELARLTSLNSAEAHVEPVREGYTFAQHWKASDTSGRNQLLRSFEVRAYVQSKSDDKPPMAASLHSGSDQVVIISSPDMWIVMDLGKLDDLRHSLATSALPRLQAPSGPLEPTVADSSP